MKHGFLGKCELTVMEDGCSSEETGRSLAKETSSLPGVILCRSVDRIISGICQMAKYGFTSQAKLYKEVLEIAMNN